MTDNNELSIELGNFHADDFKELINCMMEAYPNWEGELWKENQIAILLETFPEG